MKIVVGEQLLNYMDEGAGKVILLLHGWGANLSTFDSMTSALAKEYRVIRLDFPGFGGSPQPSADWDIGDYARMIADFLKKKDIKDIHAIIAHSFGGRVTIKLTGTGALETGRIVLIGSGGIRHSSSPRQQAYKAVAKTGGAIMKLPGLRKIRGKMKRQLYEKAGAMDYFEAGDMKNIFLRVIDEDMRETAARISIPTLLIWGENDDETPVSDGKIFHDRIEGSEMIVIPAAGHFTYLDDPATVMALTKKFLAR